jgi:hypothetical protein
MANPFPNIINTVGTLAAGHIVLATEWNTAVGGIYTYINNTLLTAGLNKLSSKGDIYVHDGTNLQRLAVGANNQVIMADSGASTGLKYAAIVSTNIGLLTTKGDLVVHNGTDLTRLPIGSDGQCLVARSSDSEGLAWETLSGQVPVGGIIMWHQSFGTIPAGYNVCDGGTYNGIVTPNMQGLYVVGAGAGVNPPASGGVGNLAVNTPGGARSHTHGIAVSRVAVAAGGGQSPVNAVSSNSTDQDPPYNTLFFIMRTI